MSAPDPFDVATLGAPTQDARGLSSEIAKALVAGKLEQTCPACGRWEAAHSYCSWCLRPMGSADWYRNSDLAERHRRRPTAAPANPSSEYLGGAANWPAAWGPFPRCQKPAREPQTPVEPANRKPADVSPTPPSSPEVWRAVACHPQLQLNLALDNNKAAASSEMTAAAASEVRRDHATPTA